MQAGYSPILRRVEMLIEQRVSHLMSVDDALHSAELVACHIDHILPRHVEAAGIIGKAIDGVAR